MRLSRKVSDAAAEVKSTATAIGNSVQWNTAALVAVSIVSVVALFVAVSALSRSAR